MKKQWKAFWSDKTSVLHKFETPEFYRVCAGELKVLFGDHTRARVLEIGCGNGALFEFLGFNQVYYKGVDFSPSLLAAFKSKYPNVELECCDGSSYVDREDKYDLIFSYGVIQYFDPPMLDRHFACARSMMHKDSLFVCATVTLKSHRSAYDSGALYGTFQPSIFRWIRAKVSRILLGDRLGYWYTPPQIASLAEKHGFSVQFYGSMAYLNTFSAVLKLK